MSGPRPDGTPAPGPCPVCGAAGARFLLDLRRTNLPRGVPGTVHACPDCRLAYKRFDTDLDAVYADDEIEREDGQTYFEGQAALRFFDRVLDDLAHAPGPNREAPRLLDVGCGAGAFLARAAARGYSCHGVERNPLLAERTRARGFPATTGDVADLAPAGAFDVITLFDVIEHLPEPMAVLRSLAGALAPGGELVVATPNHASPVARLSLALARLGLSGPAAQIFASNHVVFFDIPSLTRAVTLTGLRLARMTVRPYDPARPGGPIAPLALAGVTAVEYLGHALFGSGFRLTAHAVKA